MQFMDKQDHILLNVNGLNCFFAVLRCCYSFEFIISNIEAIRLYFPKKIASIQLN